MSHTVGQTTTSYIWDVASGLPVVVQDGDNTYVYGLDLISATDASAVQTYFLYDGLGSTTDLTDSSGNSVDDYTYDVFGALRSQSGSSSNPWLFTGEQQDADSDMYYLRARYYDPETGRFVGRDPSRAGHPYSYVRNNPIIYVDPYGLDVCETVSGWFGKKKSCKEVADEAEKTVDDAVGEGEKFVTKTAPTALRSAGNALDDLGYLDVNGTACLGVCVVGGFQVSFGEGFHPYGGGGFGTPQLTGNVTVAPGQHITTGWTCGFQVSAGSGLGLTGQVGGAGIRIDKEGRPTWNPFVEAGASIGFAPPGIAWSNTCIYIY